MRQQQNQNRRMRGRGNGGGGNNSGGNNNNRRGPNPLTRSYESNGPDVKVRGTAQHVAEKYMSLARDAQSSGDRVMAENYLQHAEHYNRIIAAAQAANAQQSQQPQNEGDDDNVSDLDARFQSNPQSQTEGTQQPFDTEAPQPVIDGVPAEVAMDEEGGSRDQRANTDQGQRDDQQREGRNRNRRPRGPRPNRAEGEGGDAADAGLDALPSFIVQGERKPEPVAAED